jgi:hypothetical protein
MAFGYHTYRAILTACLIFSFLLYAKLIKIGVSLNFTIQDVDIQYLFSFSILI